MNVVIFEQMKVEALKTHQIGKDNSKLVRRIGIVMTHLRRCQARTNAKNNN